MLRAFTVGFEKVIKSFLLLIAAFPGLIDTLCTVTSLKVPAMIVYDTHIHTHTHTHTHTHSDANPDKLNSTISAIFYRNLLALLRRILTDLQNFVRILDVWHPSAVI